MPPRANVDSACLALDATFRCSNALSATNSYESVLGFGVSGGVSVCYCSDIPESVPSVRITDQSTLCALTHLRDGSPFVHAPDTGAEGTEGTACDDYAVPRLSDAGANGYDDVRHALVWRLSQIPLAPCLAAEFDAEGPCGDEDAVIRYAPICVHVALPTRASSLKQSVITPYVSPEHLSRLRLGREIIAVYDACTAEAMALMPELSAGVACAARPCETAVAVPTQKESCGGGGGASRLANAGGGIDGDDVSSISYVCEYNGRAVDGALHSSGCQTGMVFESCGSGGGSGGGGGSGTPGANANDNATSSSSSGGVGGSPTRPVVGSPTQPVVKWLARTESECLTDACGSEGVRTVSWQACTPGTRACLPHADYALPVTTTEACNSPPCPCADGASCLPTPGQVYGAISAQGVPCNASASLVDVLGNCCSSSGEDADAAGADVAALDACGLCAGEPYEGLGSVRIGLDALGVCCSSPSSSADASSPRDMPILTRDLVCCPSVDLVDACGVCWGSGTTCAFRFRPEGASQPRDLARAAETVRASLGVQASAYQGEITVRERTRRNVTPREIATAILHALNASDSVRSVTAIPQGIEGNGLCEAGESDQSVDCVAVAASPCAVPHPDSSLGLFVGNPNQPCGGKGACSRALGECVCAYGYAGDSCSECDEGFAPFPVAGSTRACLPTDANAIISTFLNASGGSGMLPIVVGSISAALTVVVLAALAFRFRRAIVNVINVVTVTPNARQSTSAVGDDA